MKPNGKKIQTWMVQNDVTISEVARRAGIVRPIVSDTVHGERNNRKALRALLAAGCPMRLLALPEDMNHQETA